MFDETYMLRKGEDEASIDSQKEKQVMEIDEHRSRTEKCGDEESSRDSQHQEDPYSLARCRDKHDQKALEMYGFENIVSFTLITGNGDSLSAQNGMLTEVELLLKDKAQEST